MQNFPKIAVNNWLNWMVLIFAIKLQLYDALQCRRRPTEEASSSSTKLSSFSPIDFTNLKFAPFSAMSICRNVFQFIKKAFWVIAGATSQKKTHTKSLFPVYHYFPRKNTKKQYVFGRNVGFWPTLFCRVMPFLNQLRNRRHPSLIKIINLVPN